MQVGLSHGAHFLALTHMGEPDVLKHRFASSDFWAAVLVRSQAGAGQENRC